MTNKNPKFGTLKDFFKKRRTIVKSGGSSSFSTVRDTSTGAKKKTVTYRTNKDTGEVTKTVTRSRDEESYKGENPLETTDKSRSSTKVRVIKSKKAKRQIRRKSRRFKRKNAKELIIKDGTPHERRRAEEIKDVEAHERIHGRK